MKTPPGPPLQFSGDGLLLEFVLPHPIFMDEGAWVPLQIMLGSTPLIIEKPITNFIDVQPPGIFGNDCPDAFCTVIRVIIPNGSDRPGIEKEVYDIVYLMLQWFRVIGRQYWILQGTTGVAAFCRGAIFSSRGNLLTQQNFAVYDKTVLVRPLSVHAWDAIRTNTSAQRAIPVADSIFCDGLLSVAARDDVKALAELGLAAEIELTNLLTSVSKAKPSDHASVEYEKRKQRRADKFRWKLETASVSLGLENPATYIMPGMPPGWKDTLLLLYDFRGSVAHSGEAVASNATGVQVLTSGDVERFIFSTEALFHWSQEQRRQQIVAQYERPWTQFSERPLIGVLDTLKDARSFSSRANSPAAWMRI